MTLTDEARTMLRYAQIPLTPGEQRELLYWLDVAVLPNGIQKRIEAVVERLLEQAPR